MSPQEKQSVCIAAVQAALSGTRESNIANLTNLVRAARDDGAQIILLPELVDGPYFPRTQDESLFSLARQVGESDTVRHFAELAGELGVVIPISFFEKDGPHYYNSVAVADADGSLLGVYRKTHIPDGPGYQEKFYFRPGDGPLRSFKTRFATIGVAICWDQWYPEVARALVLDGADILLYPTAIGSEPHDPSIDSQLRWQRAMVGHAVSNACVVAAANRFGREGELTFYGNSFIANPAGDLIAEMPRDQAGVITARIDLQALAKERAAWGFFRDRRPELYSSLSTTVGGDGAHGRRQQPPANSADPTNPLNPPKRNDSTND